MTNIYLAGPFFDDEQLERIGRAEQALAQNPQVGHVFSPRAHEVRDFEMGTPAWCAKTFKMDTDQIDAADVVVALADYVDDQVDSGTAFEIGYAYHSHTPVILVHEKDNIVNLMLAESLQAYLTHTDDLVTYDFAQLPANRYEGEVI
ncbi:nucleoside 2-deoxyribosyltransferase [Levilactobacillus zymae]|uniref:Nucleoside 2-deoxyribosyltransferase n=1 Tax=Levilactobacillus zymae TaxID=267363 RepID=A0ABQ0WTX2_9LACO|nr:nucleoside 2-deoxyribosyltransferase [Levilactobacillus zymae]KRL15489.1 nucleoside 2-deoxyribosyltransferase [Levilactobacillus zymae DSM 19395]QFR60843.1 nucleoside 2-deoxyribosyltransferase [Levilactobacillus zymae]GEO71064.1 nucleoside 2-deoxyribosyltransferase [Levilactobacillus zymae]